MSATVTPNYSHGRRKFGRPPKVHHWDIACDECPGVNLRPSRFWEPKKRLLEIAAEHNRVAHPVLSALDGAQPTGDGMRDFRAIIKEAQALHRPVKRFALFSGGNDSGVMTHAVWMAGLIDAAVHINTGTGIPQTRTFVGDFCERYAIPLLEYHPPISYRDLVLKYGFPGPGAHGFMYNYLKERCVDQLVREHKSHSRSRIMLITGVRLSESKRRMGHVVPIAQFKRRPCSIWVAPLLDWTKDDLAAYRAAHGVPESEVAALLHMSGECLCGAFAHPDEIKDLEAFYPETAARIHSLEVEVAAVGKHAVWGTAPGKERRRAAPGILCSDCAPTDVLAGGAK